MGETEIYDREWLIENKFPHLRREIEEGYFKLLTVSEGNSQRKIARFSNLYVFPPDAKLVEYLLTEFFQGCALDDIVFASYPLGMDITLKCDSNKPKLRAG